MVGRAKAGASGYAYAAALKKLGGAWSQEALDRLLAKARTSWPGPKLSFAGMKKAKARAAVIFYLRSLSESPKPLP